MNSQLEPVAEAAIRYEADLNNMMLIGDDDRCAPGIAPPHVYER